MQKNTKAIPHNGARRFGEIFCPKRKYGKCGNTLCISHFSYCTIGAKDPPKPAAPIVRYCPKKKQDALKGACFYTLLCLITPGIMLYLRHRYCPEGFLSTLLLIVSLLDLGLIIPVWISFKERIKEIEGGEEDAAAEY